MPTLDIADLSALQQRILLEAKNLGFQHIGFSSTEVDKAHQHLQEWLEQGRHGQMSYMQRNTDKRADPAALHPGTVSVISARMDYLPPDCADSEEILNSPNKAFISRYALGRDYHKLMRKRLQRLAQWIDRELMPLGYRVFSDSAPVLEKALAQQAGLGWIGKHTNLLSRDAGSWFFLGEIFCDIPFTPDTAAAAHCGDCRACIDICPTQAIIAPYQLDARRCISYLTIELDGPIAKEFRNAIGNRIYGCDDCQLVCPWNRFAQVSQEADFAAREGLDDVELLSLLKWSQDDFLRRFEGSAIRRIGYWNWIRNIVIALGNGTPGASVQQALQDKHAAAPEWLQEHIQWSLQQLSGARPKQPSALSFKELRKKTEIRE